VERKAATSAEYQPESVVRVRRALVLIASKLGDLMGDIVVVGGLAPYLLVEQEGLPGNRRHVGTMDLDLGLSLAILDDERYREVSMRLRDCGFRPRKKPEGQIQRQTWVVCDGGHEVAVDFLISPSAQGAAPGRITQIESDFAAVTVEGLDLAFLTKRAVSITAEMSNGSTLTRMVNVTGPGAFVILKAIAYRMRGANKDAYDLFYTLREVDRGEVLSDLGRFPEGHRLVRDALEILRCDFIVDDAGRAQVAEFLQGSRDDAIEADVLASVKALLDGVT
jgi:hypothetical protein